jgi:hypothetical protein
VCWYCDRVILIALLYLSQLYRARSRPRRALCHQHKRCVRRLSSRITRVHNIVVSRQSPSLALFQTPMRSSRDDVSHVVRVWRRGVCDDENDDEAYM